MTATEDCIYIFYYYYNYHIFDPLTKLVKYHLHFHLGLISQCLIRAKHASQEKRTAGLEVKLELFIPAAASLFLLRLLMSAEGEKDARLCSGLHFIASRLSPKNSRFSDSVKG